MNTKKLAVITGAKGFIGSNLARDLAGQNIYVVLTDLDSVSDFRVRDILYKDQVDFFASSVLEIESILGFVKKVENIVRQNGIERIEFYHPAAFFSYDPHALYDKYHQINVEGTEKILQTLSNSFLKKLTRVVVWSSATVHGNAENLDAYISNAGGCNMSQEVKSFLHKHLYFKESDLCIPASRYELSKYVQELVALEAGKKYGLEVCVERPSGVYGPWSTYAAASAIFMVARGELKGIPGPGTTYVSLTHVDDVVSASQYIARKGMPGKIYTIADDGNYTIGQLFTHVAQEINKWRTKQNEPPAQFNPNFHLPIPIILSAAKWLKFTSRLTGLPAKIETDLVELFFRPARFSNKELLEIGYHFKYPDTLDGITQTIAWYAGQGWI